MPILCCPFDAINILTCLLDVLGTLQYDSNRGKQMNPTTKTAQQADVLVGETDDFQMNRMHYMLDGVSC